MDRWERIKANVKTIAGAVLLAMFIRVVLLEAFEIEGPSMEPTLLNGDRVVVAKFLYGLFLPFTSDALVNWGTPKAGHVVIVKSPADDIDIVKRVVGLAGDVIELRNGVLYRNGRSVQRRFLGECKDAADRRTEGFNDCEWDEEVVGRSDYAISHSIHNVGSDAPPTRVPNGHVYVLGDHRDRSNDSRFFGPVPVSRIKGRALLIYWSNDGKIRWHRLGKVLP